jgi:hypothetical protein
METGDDNNTGMIDKNGFKFPAALRGLIENPPLLEGENPDDFWRFLQAIVEDQKPQGTLDWISAIDIAIKSWEELRLKRSSVALIHGGLLEALIYFVASTKELKHGSKPAREFALKYFSKVPKERAELIARLAQHGITLAELHAKAAELNEKPLQMFERMIAARENGRRQLRKEAAQSKLNSQNGDSKG